VIALPPMPGTAPFSGNGDDVDELSILGAANKTRGPDLARPGPVTRIGSADLAFLV
jgi:hypothetical protein